MDEWAQQRLAQLEAAAPVKQKKVEPFVRLSLSWAARAAAATNCPKAMVWVWLSIVAGKKLNGHGPQCGTGQTRRSPGN
jgi:hypothetical protein